MDPRAVRPGCSWPTFEVGRILGMTYLHFNKIMRGHFQYLVKAFIGYSCYSVFGKSMIGEICATTKAVRCKVIHGPVRVLPWRYWRIYNLFFKMSGVVWTAVECNALNKSIQGSPDIHSPSRDYKHRWPAGLNGPWFISPWTMIHRPIILQESLLLIRSSIPVRRALFIACL